MDVGCRKTKNTIEKWWFHGTSWWFNGIWWWFDGDSMGFHEGWWLFDGDSMGLDGDLTVKYHIVSLSICSDLDESLVDVCWYHVSWASCWDGTSTNGVHKPTSITGGHHIVGLYPWVIPLGKWQSKLYLFFYIDITREFLITDGANKETCNGWSKETQFNVGTKRIANWLKWVDLSAIFYQQLCDQEPLSQDWSNWK